MKKIVAVISGGPDSIGYAAIWRSRGYEIYPIIFNYGQKGIKEVEVARELCGKLEFHEPIVIDISFMKDLWRGFQLTDESVEIESKYTSTVVVPIRNAVLLTIAAVYAYMIDAEKIIYGAHLDDNFPRQDTYEPIYPDCSPEFQYALQTALNLGYFRGKRRIEIWSPARELWTKAENLRRAFNIIGDVIYSTWSCYLSGMKHCGRCESCINRHKAFIQAQIIDKTEYENTPHI